MRRILLILAVLLAAGLGARIKYVRVRDDLSREQEAISQAWEQVDAALERRAQLIPSLTEALQQHAADERQVMAGLSEARAELVHAQSLREKMLANAKVEQAISRLLLLIDSYPRLRDSGRLQRLEDELADAENRIAVERRKYNDTVQRYNTRIELFPDNIVARMAGFTRNDAYFVPGPAATAVPLKF